jgi:hypothetical protein
LPGPTSEAQKFTLTYIDGREVNGLAHGLFAQPEGLHLYRRDSTDKLRMLFVPNRVLKSYHAGPRLGESLIAAGQVDRASCAALDAAGSARQKLGAYVPDRGITADDLKALEEQADSRPASRRVADRRRLIERNNSPTRSNCRSDRKKRRRHPQDMGATTAEAVHATIAHNLGIPFVSCDSTSIRRCCRSSPRRWRASTCSCR